MIILPCAAQREFRTEFEDFRYTLHGLLDPDHPMRISPALAAYINTFLEDHSDDIQHFRAKQLKLHERAPNAAISTYRPLPEKEVNNLKQQAVMLYAEAMLAGEYGEGGTTTKDQLSSINALLSLLRVDPLSLIGMTHSQLIPTIVTQYMKKDAAEFAPVFAGLAIGGQIFSTRHNGREVWSVNVMNPFMATTYTVNAETGEIALTSVLIKD